LLHHRRQLWRVPDERRELKTMTANLYCLTAAVALTLLAPANVAHAAPKRPAVPPALTNAKTIYLENRSANPKAVDELAARVRRWGRLRLVDARDKADLVASVGTADTPARRPARARRAAPVRARTLTLAVRRASSGDLVWSGADKSMEVLVANLRGQVEPPPTFCIAMWCK
jgi:hypothetical protein